MSSSAEESGAPTPRRADRVPQARRRGRRGLAVALVLVVAVGAALLTSMVTRPTTTYSQKSLLLMVENMSVTATLMLSASADVEVELYGVCVRGPKGEALDYPYVVDGTITRAGTRWAAAKAFPPGSYTFFACVRHGTSWWNATAQRTVTIAEQLPSGSGSKASGQPSSGSAEAMPVGDLPGWKQNFTEDFSKPSRLGEIGEVYGEAMRGYDGFSDTSKRGTYTPDRVLSVSDGILDFFLHTETVDGITRPRVATPVLNDYKGQTYGRYSLRFRADAIDGYKVAFMLWPSSDRWAEGEMNFPEGRLNASISAYSHCVGDNPGDNCLAAFTGISWQDWHVATTEWTPSGVTFFLDGRRLGTATGEGVPSTKFRWTLQTETEIGGDGTPPSAAGHVQVDWATSYSYAGS
jgi:hypothetical protein